MSFLDSLQNNSLVQKYAGNINIQEQVAKYVNAVDVSSALKNMTGATVRNEAAPVETAQAEPVEETTEEVLPEEDSVSEEFSAVAKGGTFFEKHGEALIVASVFGLFLLWKKRKK